MAAKQGRLASAVIRQGDMHLELRQQIAHEHTLEIAMFLESEDVEYALTLNEAQISQLYNFLGMHQTNVRYVKNGWGPLPHWTGALFLEV